MPSFDGYRADVPKSKDLKTVVAENVRAVMAAKKLSQPQVALLAKQKGEKIDQTTVGRIARAEIPTTLDKLEALCAGLGLEPWQILMPGLDVAKLPKVGGETLAPHEVELLQRYRGASSRWQIAVRYMAGMKVDSKQEEAVAYLYSKIFSEPVPDEKLGSGWTRPDAAAHSVHEPKAPYKGKK